MLPPISKINVREPSMVLLRWNKYVITKYLPTLTGQHLIHQ